MNLDEIKKKYGYPLEDYYLSMALKREDYHWLVEQAELTERLRKENQDLHRLIGKYSGEIQSIFDKQQNLYVDGLLLANRMLRDEKY